MPPSNSRSRIQPESERLPGPFPAALTFDVEEWYHSCWIPEYNDPRLRPALPHELDTLLPKIVEELAPTSARATFFVLGELARQNAPRLRELVAAGHEVACHGFHHFRANDLSPHEFLRQIRDAKALLEDLIGREVQGFRAPEWSLREPGNVRLARVAEAGFRYDSSLVRALWAGAAANPSHPTRYRWNDGAELVELPPMTWAGRLRLPSGGWCGRLAAPRWLLAAVRAARRDGRLPLLVVHPWELVDRPAPGLFTGLARLFHDTGRHGFRDKFRVLIAGTPWRTVAGALAEGARANAKPSMETTEGAVAAFRLVPEGAAR